MALTAKQAASRRLIEAMLDANYVSSRNAKSGVDVGPLAKTAKVTREMARRYTDGSALPDPNRMQAIADWLGVRIAWLRDGEGPKRTETALQAREPTGQPYLSEEAVEIAQIWSKLPTERREWFRGLMSLEAMVATQYPWLMFGRPGRESYTQYEKRIERDILRLAARLQGEKVR